MADDQIPERLSDKRPAMNTVAIASLRPALHSTWAEVEAEHRSRLCLCCGQPGHYQRLLDQHVAGNGVDGLAVHVEAGSVRDGHHRVVAALSAGITHLPTESVEAAGQRWCRDNGPVHWTQRKVGDVSVSEASWVVTDALMKAVGVAPRPVPAPSAGSTGEDPTST